MAAWNTRLLPHPLLSPLTDDYGTAKFVATLPNAVISDGIHINLTVQYNCTSPFLRQQVEGGKANYFGVLSCEDTFTRQSFASPYADTVLSVAAADYARVFDFTPYIIASVNISDFISDEHHQEFRELCPEGFQISAGAILAVGQPTRVTMEVTSPYSIVELVPTESVENGTFKIELANNKIQIHLSRDDKAVIDLMRASAEHQGKSALYPGLYLHAITEALRSLRSFEEYDYHWIRGLEQILSRHNLSTDEEDLKDRALEYAQRLLNRPLSRLLAAFSEPDGGVEQHDISSL